MSDTALEAVLRRDRAVVIVALAIITALAWADLAWLSDGMAMGSMDMTGYRMIPAGRGLMMPLAVSGRLAGGAIGPDMIMTPPP
jgi:predicted metal-binding membrane protein